MEDMESLEEHEVNKAVVEGAWDGETETDAVDRAKLEHGDRSVGDGRLASACCLGFRSSSRFLFHANSFCCASNVCCVNLCAACVAAVRAASSSACNSSACFRTAVSSRRIDSCSTRRHSCWRCNAESSSDCSFSRWMIV